MRSPHVTRVGAPVLEALPPAPGTPAGRFQNWLGRNEETVGSLLGRLSDRWSPLSTFVEVNFDHPDLGPAGAVVMTTVTIDIHPLRRRVRRAMVIPFSELEPYLPRWEKGETVLVSVGEMPAPLARRYTATPVVWSLNVPVHVEGTWVGLVGATAGPTGLPVGAVDGFQALARLLMRDFAADAAWQAFQATIGEQRRLRLLR